jgi:hypothetical protein
MKWTQPRVWKGALMPPSPPRRYQLRRVVEGVLILALGAVGLRQTDACGL